MDGDSTPLHELEQLFKDKGYRTFRHTSEARDSLDIFERVKESHFIFFNGTTEIRAGTIYLPRGVNGRPTEWVLQSGHGSLETLAGIARAVSLKYRAIIKIVYGG